MRKDHLPQKANDYFFVYSISNFDRVTFSVTLSFSLFRLDLRLDLHNHFRELFFAFLARFRVDIVAFPLAVGVGRRVPSLIQVVVNHGDTARPRLAYFGLVRREFDRGGIFPRAFLSAYWRLCRRFCGQYAPPPAFAWYR